MKDPVNDAPSQPDGGSTPRRLFTTGPELWLCSRSTRNPWRRPPSDAVRAESTSAESLPVIPLYHDFSDARVLVFGGGSVGARKARRFAREAAVVVVSPTFDDAFDEPELASVDRIRAAPEPADAADWVDRFEPALVVAATDDSDLNSAVDEAASDHGSLINRTDQSGGRDVDSVVVPATVRDGPVSVAISTGGRSPALARYLRQRIEAEIEDAGAMAELTGELRRDLKAAGYTPTDRREAVRSVVRSSSVWKALHTGTPNPQKEAERVMAVEHDDMDGASR